MKIAHLILVHKDPGQLDRLLRALDHPAFDFFIHVDKKSDITPFLHLKKENVSFLENRTPVYWAGFGTIQATLNGFHDILAGKKEYDYINVISGQDFPIKSARTIYEYIAERKGKEFITCESIDGPWQSASRIRKYHLINWRIPGKFKIEKLVNRIMPPRKFPVDHEIVGRANWFTLSVPAIRYCLQYLKENPKIIRFYKYVWGADEFIFSTILYNSPFRDQIVDNLVYVDWEGQIGHPRLLTIADFPTLQASDKLFARKIDMSKYPGLVSLLEDWIGVNNRENQQ